MVQLVGFPIIIAPISGCIEVISGKTMCTKWSVTWVVCNTFVAMLCVCILCELHVRKKGTDVYVIERHIAASC